MKYVLIVVLSIFSAVGSQAGLRNRQSQLKLALNGGVAYCASKMNFYNKAKNGAFIISKPSAFVTANGELQVKVNFNYFSCRDMGGGKYAWKGVKFYTDRQFTHFLWDEINRGLRSVQVTVEVKEASLVAVSDRFIPVGEVELTDGKNRHSLTLDLEEMISPEQKHSLDMGKTVRVRAEIFISSSKRFSNSDGVRGEWSKKGSAGSVFLLVYLKKENGAPKVMSIH